VTPSDVFAGRELDAANITDARLRASYRLCRRLNAKHGRTYYLSTLLLPPAKRPAVHALYGFARYADEIVDDLASTWTHEQKAAALTSWGERVLADARTGHSDDPVAAAVVHTITRWDIPLQHFADFLASMRMDLTVTEYKTYDDLRTYIHGSAAVIGRQMVPILEPTVAVAADYAEDLGVAFQLTNFIRDVGEDLQRGRLYLPLDELAAFDVTRDQLAAGVVDARVRRLLAFQVARARELYRSARHGISLLHPSSRPCVETAYVLYRRILDEVERADYRVLDRRVAVGTTPRLHIAGRGFVRALRSRA
jgi:phytoene synthase